MTTSADRQVNVLLADDSLLSRELAAAFLGELGFSYSTAANGSEALGLLESSSFHLVLLDIEMPVLNGYDTARKIREAGMKLPIIAMTGHDTDSEREKCTQSGIDACVTKPFQKEKLHSLMLALLNILRPEQALPGSTHDGGDARSSAKVTDLTHLAEISRGRKDFFMSMISIFLEQNREDMDTLEAALRKSDFDTIRLMAHKIGTSVSFVGLERHVLPQLKEMEQLGEQKINLPKARKLFYEVALVCETAEKELVAVQAKEKN